ncbi:hypothetical protein EXS61_02185 [Candidatus Parcubacteria bacterium]|nr:hypothetical protein [Candidatus Parcubacteria bacterium]
MLNKITIVIGIILVIVVGIFLFLYFTRDNKTNTLSDITTSIRDFFPFGRGSVATPETDIVKTNPNQNPVLPDTNTAPPRLRQIYPLPVSGSEIFTVASSTFVRFLEKSTGNVHESKTDKNTVERISNTTIPKVTEAVFVKKDAVLLRYLKDDSDIIETVFGSLGTTTATTAGATTTREVGTPAELVSTYLTPNINGLAVSDKKDKMFYMTELDSGARGVISNPDGSKGATVFDSPIREWVVQWPKTDTIALNTKASAQLPGYLYFLNTVTGKQKLVLGDWLGLTTLTNTNATKVLHSFNDNAGKMYLQTYKIVGETFSPTLSTPTLTEKCVWSKKNIDIVYCAIPKNLKGGAYPDDWYKGLISFEDNLWKIDTVTGTTEQILNIFEVAGTDIDAVNLSIDAEEKFLVFTNKKNLSLWSYAL